MYEILTSSASAFVIRTPSTDRDTVEGVERALFLKAMRDAHISAGDTILDLGSHIGSFAIVAAKERQCRVIGFEGDVSSLRIAKANTLLNDVADLVEFHQVAVGGGKGVVPFYEATENWGHTIIERGGPYNILTGRVAEVPLITLGCALSYVPGGRCAFMKFNIEGAEHEMLETAPPDVLVRIDAMAGEIHYDLGRGDVRSYVKKLQDCGFVVELVPQYEVRAILLARRN